MLVISPATEKSNRRFTKMPNCGTVLCHFPFFIMCFHMEQQRSLL